jgi:fibronectin type 3 domain-containing protein
MSRIPLPLLGAVALLLGLAGNLYAASASLSWNANGESDLAGYKVHMGTAANSYDTTLDVGNVTSYSVPSLNAGTTYHFAISAYDTTGNESALSGDVAVTTTAVNTAPVVTAPPNKTVEATGALTSVSLGTATASDAEDGTLTATASDTGPFAPGTHTITWTATDSNGATGTATQTVTVNDTTKPTVTAPPDKTVEATALLTPVSLGTATATDLVDGSLTATASPTGPFARGTHTITWTATDSHGNSATATQTVTVEDTTPPQAPSGLTITAN